MALSTMYPGINNSPKTTLTANITAAATSITVADASVLPAAPNIAVIGSAADAEVILYTSIVNNVLGGITRGIGGTMAKSWETETVVARNFTMYDYKTLCDNITDLENRKSDSSDLGSLASKNKADLGSDVSGTLPIANGGTGLTASPSLQVNLASTAAANVMAASPRPGVTGTLPVGNGGTGATSAANARTNLGITAIATRPNYIISSTDIGEGHTLANGTIYFCTG